MSKISFGKYQGAGNDFILIDDRRLFFPTADSIFIHHLCDRKFGIGADGLILLQPDFRMRIFNRDGNEVESCGNGLRCLARFISDLGETPSQIRVGDQIVSIDLQGEKIGIEMGAARDLKLHFATEKGVVHCVNTGVPHVVFFVPKVEEIDIATEGPYFRHRFGANANFAAVQPDGSIRVRTFERGVEGETLACGTGACAVALIAQKVLGLSDSIPIDFPGGRLEIQLRGNKMKMIGPAVKVFDGNFTQR